MKKRLFLTIPLLLTLTGCGVIRRILPRPSENESSLEESSESSEERLSSETTSTVLSSEQESEPLESSEETPSEELSESSIEESSGEEPESSSEENESSIEESSEEESSDESSENQSSLEDESSDIYSSEVQSSDNYSSDNYSSDYYSSGNYSSDYQSSSGSSENYSSGQSSSEESGYYDGYYSSISKSWTGTKLLQELQKLNSKKRTSTVGYGSMGTSASGQFKYTDYDPSTVKYDSKGQPYGTKIISFYSGNTTTSFNREHVWPNSHGGSKVDNDIHMTRPTIESENGSRGNSFYVEGKKDTKYGWDPAMESFGDETYRGDSARIIFYCMVAYTGFSLVELDYHDTSKANPDYMMGRLSHMIKWNEEYDVQERENRRNDGAEYLQGNRNPFIDHPEFACKIWGDENDATRQYCKLK